MRYAQDFGFTFSAYSCFAVLLPHTLIFFFSELTHAFSFHADTMLGKNMLADLKALARNHGLATGSQLGGREGYRSWAITAQGTHPAQETGP